MKLTRLLIVTAVVIITSAVWTTKSSLARLQTTPPDLTTVYATSSAPLNLIVERPGRIWFTLPDTSAIGSLIVTSTVEFQFTQFTTPTPNSEPYDLAYANGTIWFTEHASNQIGQLDVATGVIQEFAIPTANSAPTGIAVAPNGHVWFTERTGNRLGRFTPGSNTIDEFPYPTTNAQLEDLAIGGDGKIWATAPEIAISVGITSSNDTGVSIFMPAGTRPGHRRSKGIRTPPSVKEPFSPRRGSFLETGRSPPLSEARKTTVLSFRPRLSIFASTMPTLSSMHSTMAAWCE